MSSKPTDRFRDQIKERLDQPLDPNRFELCVNDLLRSDYPTLVPVTGGNDGGGFDGAITDGESEPYPLIVTSQKDYQRNFRKNLERVVSSRSGCRVVFATSRPVTPQQRKRLEKTASNLGCKLIQIYDRDALALRLEQRPDWCRKLLELSSQPEALSPNPFSRRPTVSLKPIGRDEDLAWLRRTSGDRIVSGQPGSGKTFLLKLFSDESSAQFLRPWAQSEEIVDELRSKRPSIVMVDDAHVDPSRLEQLRGLRQDIGDDFSILATTWVGSLGRIRLALGDLPSTQVRKLSLLTREQIVSLLGELGVEASTTVLRELVDQAANKPGLAVSVGTAWLRGERKDVLTGEALHRHVVIPLLTSGSASLEEILASFALGGDHGMKLEAVARSLNLDLPLLRRTAAELDAAGILDERAANAVSVWPRQLRAPLVKGVFLGTPARLNPNSLMAVAESQQDVLLELIRARSIGADIALEELQELLSKTETTRPWQAYAWLGAREARWVLCSFPGRLSELADPLLEHIPEQAIGSLLCEATQSLSSGDRSEPPAIGAIRAWTRRLETATESLERREQLARSALLPQSTEVGTLARLWALCLALSPALESTETDPGAGRRVTMIRGLLTGSAIARLQRLIAKYGQPLAELLETDPSGWPHVDRLLWDWRHPEVHLRREIADELRDDYREVAVSLLQAVARAGAKYPGIAAQLAAYADDLEVEIEIARHPDFEALYPAIDNLRDETEMQRREEAATALADRWQGRLAEEIAADLVELEREADRISRCSRFSGRLVERLAELSDDPSALAQALADAGVAPQLLAPTLERILACRVAGWEGILERVLVNPNARGLAVGLLLSEDELPDTLLSEALEAACEFPDVVATLCLRGEVPDATLQRLIAHSDTRTALAAATGTWYATPQGEIPSEVAKVWRKAILSATAGDTALARDDIHLTWLGDILGSDPTLAESWLRQKLSDGLKIPIAPVLESGPLWKAISVLNRSQRRDLLASLDAEQRGLVPWLIDRDPHLFESALEMPQLEQSQLTPLAGKLDDRWTELARIALRHGHRAQEIAGDKTGVAYEWVGSPIPYWSQREEFFARLEEDEELQEVGRIGRELARKRLEVARDEERSIELHGLSR